MMSYEWEKYNKFTDELIEITITICYHTPKFLKLY